MGDSNVHLVFVSFLEKVERFCKGSADSGKNNYDGDSNAYLKKVLYLESWQNSAKKGAVSFR